LRAANLFSQVKTILVFRQQERFEAPEFKQRLTMPVIQSMKANHICSETGRQLEVGE